MGWKNIKEHFRIEHIVCVKQGEGLCIGSPYIYNIIVLALDGTVKKRNDRSGSNPDLDRYQREIDATPASKIKELLDAPDTFAAALAVYTYDGGTIKECRCEAYGWPNITHDGQLMYENTFSAAREKIVQSAKRNAQAGIEIWTRNLQDSQKRVTECETELGQAKRELAQLNAENP